jgi:hypothetical protein
MIRDGVVAELAAVVRVGPAIRGPSASVVVVGPTGSHPGRTAAAASGGVVPVRATEAAGTAASRTVVVPGAVVVAAGTTGPVRLTVLRLLLLHVQLRPVFVVLRVEDRLQSHTPSSPPLLANNISATHLGGETVLHTRLRLVGYEAVVRRGAAARHRHLVSRLAVHPQVQDRPELGEDLAQLVFGRVVRQITQEELVLVAEIVALRTLPVI